MSTLPRLNGAVNQDNTFSTLMGDYQSPAYAATIALTIKSKASKTIVQPATLTGAVTFTANVGDDTADDVAPYVGDEIIFLLVSDGTTRTATFGTGFLPNGTLAVTTAKFASIRFIFNGASWIEMSRTVTA
jgi:hypothetical protein